MLPLGRRLEALKLLVVNCKIAIRETYANFYFLSNFVREGPSLLMLPHMEIFKYASGISCSSFSTFSLGIGYITFLPCGKRKQELWV